MPQPLRALPARARSDSEAALRLVFVEELLATRSEPEAASLTLEWLARRHGVERGLAAVSELGGGRLVGLAGRGVSAAAVERFSVGLDHRSDLLALAAIGREPVFFRGRRNGHRASSPTPFGRGPFHALPLTRFDGQEEPALGLLLVTGLPSGPPPDGVVWSAGVFGARLRSLRYRAAETERARTQQRRAWLQQIINAVTDPILLTDAGGRILVANAGADALFVADEGASEGRRRAVTLNNMLFSAALFTRVERPTPKRRELLLVDPAEGRDLLFELLATPMELGAGESGVAAVLRDVTDLRRASEELEENYRKLRGAEAEARAERDRLNLIIDAVAEPVLVTDPTGELLMMNPPADRLFEADPAAADREAEVRVAANDAMFTSFLANLTTGQERRWRGELSFADPRSGGMVPVEAIAAKVFSPQGEQTAIVTILHDQTEAMEKAQLYEQVKRHSEELRERVLEATAELAEQNELLRRQALELEQVSALKSQFLANISHELRTPLNAMIGYTHMLLEGVAGELAPAQRDKLRRVDSNTRHLLSIINDLLDIARIESGKLPVNLETFGVAELIDEVTAEMEPLIHSSGLDFRVELGEVPDVRSDRQKVKQIVLNLLSNALKFTERGSVAIGVLYESAVDRVAIAVADTGPGITAENQRKIFEAFAHATGSAPRRFGGTGLGLSICRRLATVLGGEIRLHSRPGEGSVFTLHLPRQTRKR